MEGKKCHYRDWAVRRLMAVVMENLHFFFDFLPKYDWSPLGWQWSPYQESAHPQVFELQEGWNILRYQHWLMIMPSNRYNYEFHLIQRLFVLNTLNFLTDLKSSSCSFGTWATSSRRSWKFMLLSRCFYFDLVNHSVQNIITTPCNVFIEY